MEINIKKIVSDVIARKTMIGETVYCLDENQNLLNAGLDSFQLMNVIVELESRLNIVFKDEDLIIIRFQNLKEICDSIQEVLMKYDVITTSN